MVQANVCLSPLPVTGTHQADVCPLPSDQSKSTSVPCLLTGPSQRLSFAFCLSQDNVCPLPANRYPPTGTPITSTLPLVPTNQYLPSGTLQPVLSDRYLPTGTFRLPPGLVWFLPTVPSICLSVVCSPHVNGTYLTSTSYKSNIGILFNQYPSLQVLLFKLLCPSFSVFCKSHPGTLYCWYPSFQSILYLWCNSCQIHSCKMLILCPIGIWINIVTSHFSDLPSGTYTVLKRYSIFFPSKLFIPVILQLPLH